MADPGDKRRLTVSLTAEGRRLFERSVQAAHQISARTVAPLSEDERATLHALLLRLT